MLVSVWKRYVEDISGATAIEYGLIAALIGVAAIAGMQLFGTNTHRFFWCIRHTLAHGEEYAAARHSCQTLGIHQ